MTTKQTTRRIKGLKNLRQLLTEDEDGLAKYVYSKLRLGDVWWIPDDFTKFGNNGYHPWVIVGAYSIKRPNIFAAPRTTKNLKRKGLITPADHPPGLSEEGLVLLNFRRPFSPRDFRDFDYIGRLSEDIIKEILQYYNRERSHGK